MSSSASDRVRAGCALLGLVLVPLAGCARPAPIPRQVEYAPSCRFGAEGEDVLVSSVQLEVWASPSAPSMTRCGQCRSGATACTLLSSRCVTFAGPTPVGSLDVALAGMTLPASDEPLCVMVIGVEGPSCAGLPCEAGRCDDVTYCASSYVSAGGLGVGLASQACLSLEREELTRMALGACLHDLGADAGAGLVDLDAGLRPDAEVGPRPPPVDAGDAERPDGRFPPNVDAAAPRFGG